MDHNMIILISHVFNRNRRKRNKKKICFIKMEKRFIRKYTDLKVTIENALKSITV